MDLSTLKTNRGAVVSIHRGKITTTNIWWENGWFVITDQQVLQKLDEIIAAEKANRPTDAEQTAIWLRNNFSDPTKIGYPYRRQGGPRPVQATQTSTCTSQTNAEPQPQPTQEEIDAQKKAAVAQLKKSISERLINFFSEFKFNPSPRFVNTLCYNSKSQKDARQYAVSYFKLIGHMYASQVAEKTKSDEWKNIITDIQQITPYMTNKVNHRLIIFYGPAGSGKTTSAMVQNPNAKVIGCSGTMDATDMMKCFTFNDANGNPQFKPSEFQDAMVNGDKIILDEFGLLPIDTMRFMQNFLDNKEEIYYEGNLIKIHPDFQVIATMNDIVNAQDIILPEPIVDRAAELKYYETSADILTKYAF